MIKYVLGFMFSEDMESIALILKNRPKWQAGLLNGIGGKVEPNESYMQAMEREFTEETGSNIPAHWVNFATITGIDYQMECFVAIGDLNLLETTTDEPIMIVEVAKLHTLTLMYNLRWLIPLALDKSIYHCQIQTT